MGLYFQRAVLRATWDARGHSLGPPVVQLRDLLAQLFQADGFVAVLASLLLRADDDASAQVPETHSALSFVDVLSAGPAGTEGLDLTLAQQVGVRFG